MLSIIYRSIILLALLIGHTSHERLVIVSVSDKKVYYHGYASLFHLDRYILLFGQMASYFGIASKMLVNISYRQDNLQERYRILLIWAVSNKWLSLMKNYEYRT